MNISLRQIQMDDSQTMFITSTGTVLFTSHMVHDQYGRLSTTVITSVDGQGSVVEAGLIQWNLTAGCSPSLFFGTNIMDWRMIGRDTWCMRFRGGDRQIYWWRVINDMIVLSADSASSAPVAIVHGGAHVVDFAETLLCIQPTGFHLLQETVVTFMLFKQLYCAARAENSHKKRAVADLRRESCVLLEAPCLSARGRASGNGFTVSTCMKHSHPAMLRNCEDGARHHIPFLRTTHITRSTADLTGELLRRHRYPSAYGGYGDVWKCDWLKDSRVIEVAVKVMRTNLTGSQKETESKRISRELKVWVRLEHQCVLPLYGISFDFGKFPAMVCPWIEGGTLSKYIEHHEKLPLDKRLQLLGDIADGLHYLHGCGIVHGDLTGSNVLIKDNGKACLSDFGLSRIFMEATGSSHLTSTVRGNIRWAAPELFEVGEDHQKEPIHILPNPENDVYSFGSTMLQTLTGKVPYHYYKNDAQVLVALSRGSRPVRPDEPPIDDFLWAFIQRCWSESSPSKQLVKNARPSVEEIVDFLSFAGNRCFKG